MPAADASFYPGSSYPACACPSSPPSAPAAAAQAKYETENRELKAEIERLKVPFRAAPVPVCT